MKFAAEEVDIIMIGFDSSWTPDAPYRETAETIGSIKESGMDCVESKQVTVKFGI